MCVFAPNHEYYVRMIRSDSVVSLGVTWFISRHKSAIDWVKAHDLPIDRWVPHLDPDDVNAGDTVIGSLPVNLAAAICKRGARYFHLSVVVLQHYMDKICQQQR